jgi:two-component system response regulator AtoC
LGNGSIEQGANWDIGPKVESLEQQTRKMLLKALAVNSWVQKDAAKSLGISPRRLNYMIKRHGLKHPNWVNNK